MNMGSPLMCVVRAGEGLAVGERFLGLARDVGGHNQVGPAAMVM